MDTRLETLNKNDISRMGVIFCYVHPTIVMQIVNVQYLVFRSTSKVSFGCPICGSKTEVIYVE